MNYNNNIAKQTMGIVRYSCGLLFMLFCFCYLYFLQGDLLAEAQFVSSHGLTTYSILIGSLTVTIVLQVLQWLVGHLLKFNGRYYSLSYFPSLQCLSMLTSLRQDAAGHFTFGVWLWLCPALLVAYLLLVIFLRKVRYGEEQEETQSLLWQNYLILFVMILCCGATSQTREVYHYELKTERLIMAHSYDEAADVANTSLKTSRRLTELRMFALAQQGLLAENLFDYPQYDGADGLLSISDTDSVYRYPALRICHKLGAIPDYKTIRTTRHYLRILNSKENLRTPVTQDYYLCYLLLQKDLKAFAKVLPQFYPDTVTTAQQLPRAYREAILYINKNKARKMPYSIDSETAARYDEYQRMKADIADDLERTNLTRRAFGNTFWWYYEYQNK